MIIKANVNDNDKTVTAFTKICDRQNYAQA